MPSDVEEEDSNENIMTDEDKQKYQYLQLREKNSKWSVQKVI